MQLFFKFEPLFKRVLWGGDKIARLKGISLPHSDVGESWEISGVKGHECIVANGPEKGLSLRQLTEKYGSALVGERNYSLTGNELPILIKIIDAHDQLSIQVHPDDNQAHLRGETSGKSEMWYILETEPDATILSGLCRRTDKAEFNSLLTHGDITSILTCHHSHVGDVFNLPARRIHSIGAGNLLVEIQQPSDITYRVYDFDRTDANGNKRELHTQLALDTADFNDVVKHPQANVPSGNAMLLSTPQFTVWRHEVPGKESVPLPNKSFLTLTCVGGEASISSAESDETATLKCGESLLIAAAARQVTLTGNATLIVATK